MNILFNAKHLAVDKMQEIRGVLACECSSECGQQPMSPSWILNASRRRRQAKGTFSSCVVDQATKILRGSSFNPESGTSSRALRVPFYCRFSPLCPAKDNRERDQDEHDLLLPFITIIQQPPTKIYLRRNQRHIKRVSRSIRAEKRRVTSLNIAA